MQQNNNSPRRKKMSFTMKDAYSVMLREYPDVMNIEQMSQALGVSTKTGYGLLKSGKVACLKVGRAYRIPKVHLLTYMKVMEQEKSGKTKG
jgi:excisionase family DNA binding protein